MEREELTTIIECPKSRDKLRVPLDKGEIKVKCPCGHKFTFEPFRYSTLEDLTMGSYYLPDFENNLKLGKS